VVKTMFAYPLSIAPMMKRTDRHYRYMMRQITRRTLLYTEMITTGAILNGDHERLLGYHDVEHPLALQLGGDDPGELAECARIAVDFGYDEVNLNVGCPSKRVQNGNFGVCLMEKPDVVAACVEAMRAAVDIPVTVKHRIGFDELDRYEDMANFVRIVSESGCTRFTVHARKAWLSGLSPKENRNVPPLRYEDVYRLKREFPGLVVEINGGIVGLAEVAEHLNHVDAVMIGRGAYDDPFSFARADRDVFGDVDAPIVERRRDVVEAMLPYVADQVARGVNLAHITRHMLQLFSGVRGASVWRRHLSERSRGDGAGPQVLVEAIERVEAA